MNKVATVWAVLMLIVVAYGFSKAMGGDICDNLERQVDGLMYIVCALAGLVGYQLNQNLSLQKRLDAMERKSG